MAFVPAEFTGVYTQFRNNLQHSIVSPWSLVLFRQRVFRSCVGAEFGKALRQARQSLFRGGEGRFFLAEREPHLRRAIGGITVETRARNDRYANLFDEKFGESYIVGGFFGATNAGAIKVKARDIGHDVVGASRLEYREASSGEDL
jgi:hypothetical protein